MKRFYYALFFVSLLFSEPTFARQDPESAMRVVERVAKEDNLPVKFKLEKSKAGQNPYFEYHVKNGVLHVKGNSGVALCRGFYDYAKINGLGINSWSGSNIDLPKVLPAAQSKKVVSPFQHHYYFNVVTYGYSMPYWDWERWEREIDWMAMHGIDMPLALVAYEPIIARVWRKMGLTEEEINAYFVGPAHLPWMRMGNISGIDGPLNDDWHRQQVELQHKILDRMRSLGMKPICPGFPGFIPEAFKRIHPELNIITTHWGGAFHNFMISPDEELFSRIGTEFIREWEKEFGKGEYYLVDSFNELEIPFPDKGSPERYELLASYGEKVYQSIKAGSPDAVWTMQGWMFGYQRHIWDYETLQALVSRIPDDKMLLLDLAVDYNKHFWHSEVNWEFYKGFYDKPWVYSVIPNMGGKTGLTGVLEFYANGHLEALNSPNKGRLVGHGSAPEGIENNEVIYELLSDAGWSDRKIDLRAWLENYSRNRYGQYPQAIENYWGGLLESVYGTFTDHPRYNWQFRPGMIKNGSININEHFFRAIEEFASCAKEVGFSSLYRLDLAELTALYLGGKVEILTKLIDQAYRRGDLAETVKLEQDFEYLMRGMDMLLATHPNLRLETWLSRARNQGVTPEQKIQYERNARRIVTIWGPPVDDYSARVWSGLVRDYYLPRWKHFFESRRTGESFDFATWEREWVESTKRLPVAEKHCEDVVALAQELIAFARPIHAGLLEQSDRLSLGSWGASDVTGTPKEMVFAVPADRLRTMGGVRFCLNGRGGEVEVADLRLITDGVEISRNEGSETLTGEKPCRTMMLDVLTDSRANNSCEIRFMIRSTDERGVAGELFIQDLVM